ncbi:WhiB family transcriptional regulator [Nocardioidaceae bacterium SCSIO 66511]|nr:WhiB family transcriptional regulator [Nocardioidaceae bacterium SCSIO 66511]
MRRDHDSALASHLHDLTEWVARAQCANVDVGDLFVSGANQSKATNVCRSCPVASQCLTEALQNDIEWGIWGGTTEPERRRLAFDLRTGRRSLSQILADQGLV